MEPNIKNVGQKMISDDESLELDAAITQIKTWSNGCPMECPLGALLKSVLKVLAECEKRDALYRKEVL